MYTKDSLKELEKDELIIIIDNLQNKGNYARNYYKNRYENDENYKNMRQNYNKKHYEKNKEIIKQKRKIYYQKKKNEKLITLNN